MCVFLLLYCLNFPYFKRMNVLLLINVIILDLCAITMMIMNC